MTRNRNHPRRAALAALLAALTILAAPLSSAPALAQDATPPTPPATPAPAPTIPFREYVASLWHGRSGTLLFVAPPAKVAPINADAPDTPRTWLQLTTGASAAFPYTARRFGDITVLAPRVMLNFVSNLAPVTAATALAMRDEYAARYRLLGSLSPEQWKQVTAPSGIGFDDLDGGQREIWEGMVPNPFAYQKRPATGEASSRLLSPDERHKIRFRVLLTSDVRAKLSTGSRAVLYYKRDRTKPTDALSVLGTAESAKLAGLPPPSAMPEDEPKDGTDDAGEWHYGQLVMRKDRAHPKPTDLDPATLIGTVSLAAEPGKPLTVGTITARVRVAAGVPLFALAPLASATVETVTPPGASDVAAGDALAAITFATQTTVRRIPPAAGDAEPLYALSRDREPVAREQARLGEWYEAGGKSAEARDHDSRRKIREHNPLPLLRFDPDDPVKPSPELMRRYIEGRTADPLANNGWGIAVRRTELAPAEQTFLAAQIAKINRDDAEARSRGDEYAQKRAVVPFDTLFVSASVSWSFRLPDEPMAGGHTGVRSLASVEDWLPKREVPTPGDPPALAGRALMLSAPTGADAKSAVVWAKTQHAAALWLCDAAPETVALAVVEAGNKLSVYVALSLLDARNAPPGLPRDANIFGASIPTLCPDDTAVIAYARGRVEKMAAVPGIAGIVLRDAVPIAYRGDESDGDPWHGGNGGWRDAHTDRTRVIGGYTAAHRRAYLRETGADPADILPDYTRWIGLADYSDDAEGLPKNPFGRDLPSYHAWEAWLQKRCEPLYAAAREAAGAVPTLLEGTAVFDSVALHEVETETGNTFDHAKWYLPWKASTPVPLAGLYTGTWGATVPLPDADAGAFVRVFGAGTLTPAAELLARTKRDALPRLTVVDLSDLPADKVRNICTRQTAVH